jgi:GT2 family glycosyltransferase
MAGSPRAAVEIALPVTHCGAAIGMVAVSAGRPAISIIIVNYKVPEFIMQAISSIKAAAAAANAEIIVVDNASEDQSKEIIGGQFPEVLFIGLKKNIGFGKACNIGVRHSHGEYLLFLNPDTLISHNTLEVCLRFMAGHPDIGILGPKIINPDGSLQSGCRRSFPTPLNSFYYLFGLARLFPHSKRFGAYNLNYLDSDLSLEVDAVAGSFMFMRRVVFKEIDGFDEAFFMYGEDLDLCAKVKQNGYKVWYHPETRIIHFKAQSSRKQSLRSRVAFYEAMILFSRKYRNSYGAYFPDWLITFGIGVQAVFNMGTVILKSGLACMIDILVINLVMWVCMTVRFYHHPFGNPYSGGYGLIMAAMHLLISMIFVMTYFTQRLYMSERYTPRRALVAGLIAAVIFFACVFFIDSMRFSRIAFTASAIMTPLALVGWREILPRLIRGINRLTYTTGGVIIVGNTGVASQLIRNTEEDKTASIEGIVWPVEENVPGDFDGYRVLGSLRNIASILEKNRADLLLIATTESWHSHVIEALATRGLRSLTIKWVRSDQMKQKQEDLPPIIQLQDFSV